MLDQPIDSQPIVRRCSRIPVRDRVDRELATTGQNTRNAARVHRVEQACDPCLHIGAEQGAERTESEHGEHGASPDRLAPRLLLAARRSARRIIGGSAGWPIRREGLFLRHRRTGTAL